MVLRGEEVTEAIPEFETLLVSSVLLGLVVIYLASKVGGELANRFKFPPVLGELLGGTLIGVSAFHLIAFSGEGSTVLDIVQWTEGMDAVAKAAVAKTQGEVLSVLSELGVIILLFEIGLESNLRQLVRVGPQALVVACVGVVLPFAAGTAGLMLIFHLSAIPAVFAGAALTATSIGITSRVLSELGRLNSPEGQIILGAAVIDDVLGVIVLAVVASLAKTGEIKVTQVIWLIASAVLFLGGSLVLGRVFNLSFVAIAKRLRTRGGILIPAAILAFLMAYIGAALRLEAILGSFAAGLVLDESDERNELDELVRPVADIFVPIFFVGVGARTDVSVLNPFNPDNWAGLTIASFLIVVAVIGKVATGWSVFGKPGINRLAVGFGMIPRGEVGLVFAGVGAGSGVLSPALNAGIIVMVILTTFVAPPLLRLAFGKNESPEAVTP